MSRGTELMVLLIRNLNSDVAFSKIELHVHIHLDCCPSAAPIRQKQERPARDLLVPVLKVLR